jgi:dynein heavy chain, axonemal
VQLTRYLSHTDRYFCLQGIDAVIADVNRMLQNVRTVDFNIFDQELALEWQSVVNKFREQNSKAKDATRSLIDTSFRKLRSAEGAFELLQNFKKIKSKGAIKEQMESKLNDILEQFSREIDSIKSIFESQRYVHCR